MRRRRCNSPSQPFHVSCMRVVIVARLSAESITNTAVDISHPGWRCCVILRGVLLEFTGSGCEACM